MAGSGAGGRKAILNGPVFLAIGAVASLLAIITFITGKDTILDFFTTEEITGTWQGQMYQRMPDGRLVYYDYEMSLTQSGNSVEGTARTNFPQPYQAYYAVHNVRGTEESEDVFSIDDGQLVEGAVPPGTFWCQKVIELRYDPSADTLEGSWSQSGCGSGEVVLERV